MTFLSYAKVNLFLKITGKRENYHTISSRFCLIKSLFDTIEFKPKDRDTKIQIEGSFSCSLEQNSIHKACKILSKHSKLKKIDEFLSTHKIVIDKKIPEFAGLGGGSSNAATILNALNQILELKLKKDELSYLGSKIGADVAFFIHEYPNANVSGIGEVVEFFEDEELEIELFLNQDIKCSTINVYNCFREHFFHTIDNNLATNLANMKNHQIRDSYINTKLNDLLYPAIKLYPELKKQADLGYLFSGSGSTFFEVKN